MAYQILELYDFEVDPVKSTPEAFALWVEVGGGRTVVMLPKFEFQKDSRLPLPRTLRCRVRGIDSYGVPELGHSIPQYVNQLYHTAYERGEAVEFEVITVPENPAETAYRLKDANGLFYNLREHETLLSLGQKIRCKFTRLNADCFDMQLVDDNGSLPFENPQSLLSHAGVSAHVATFILRHVFPMAEFSVVREELAAGRGQWQLSGINVARRHLAEWFSGASLRRHNTLLAGLVDALRRVTLYLLEGSQFLNALYSERRRDLQRELTESVEALRPYSRALEIISKGEQDEFVDSIFAKLTASGYLYHPANQLAVLMLIFREFPQKVSENLAGIFESILGRDLENWKREPFRSAFVEQFDIYVRQGRRAIDALPVADTKEQKAALESVITVTAMQMLLADSRKDMRLTRSLFYRYISLLRPEKGLGLLSKAFLALMGVRMNDRFDFENLRQPMMMMTKASVMSEGDPLLQLKVRKRYSGPKVEVAVSSDGISLCLSGENSTEKNIPEGLMNWLRPQVFVNGIKSLSGSRLKNISDHKIWWQEIENALFTGTTLPDKPVLRRPVLDEELYVVVDGIDTSEDEDNPWFLCHVQHEGVEECRGRILRSDVVAYRIRQPHLRMFRDSKDQGLGLLARVTGVLPSGEYRFSLRDEIDRAIPELFNTTDEYTAVVTGSNNVGYSGITNFGIGLYLQALPGEKYTQGNIVRFRYTRGYSQGSVFGEITGVSEDPLDRFNQNEAFSVLMSTIGYPDEADPDTQDQNGTRDSDYMDEELTASDVREIVEIIRLAVSSHSDMLKAYDYLRFGRLLALAIKDDNLAGRLASHAGLLELHQYFAVNRTIDAEALAALRVSCEHFPLLRRLFHRLEIVSWLGTSGHEAELFECATGTSSDLEAELSRMVLSYNMVTASDTPGTDNEIASGLKNKIMEKLKVNTETRSGKYYGQESKYLEFKTSLVYVATGAGKELREDPGAQQFHILSRIAGMLNAGGGQLLIGVNNDGYAVGLHDDLQYYRRHRAMAGNYRQDIRSLDNMCVFLENLINETFGAAVGRKIEISLDNDNDPGKEVIRIDIHESLEPVLLQGRLFVRQSGQSTREYHGRDEEEFRAERARLLVERNATLEEAAAALRQEVASEEPENVNVPAATEEVVAEDSLRNPLATCRWRKNVLHNYEEDFAQPCGYLIFMNDNSVTFSRTDTYQDSDPECRLVIAVADELEDGSLVLAYEGEKLMRVDMRWLTDHEGESLALNDDHTLEFAAVAAKNEAVLDIFYDGNEAYCRRCVPVSDIASGHTGTAPVRPFPGAVRRTRMWEIIAADSREYFSDCTVAKLSVRKQGTSLRVNSNDPMSEERIEETLAHCKP